MRRNTAGFVALFLALAACSSDPVAEPTTTTTTSTTIPVTTTTAAVEADEIQVGCLLTLLRARGETPEEIAGTAVYLASGESRFTTGQTLVVDGGYTIC